MQIMQALQSNLDGKSKHYRDPALTHLFLMNNIHYIVRSVRRYVLYMLFLEFVYLCKLVTYLMIIFLDPKPRICSVTIGFRDIGGLYNNMQISIKGMLGQR